MIQNTIVFFLRFAHNAENFRVPSLMRRFILSLLVIALLVGVPLYWYLHKPFSGGSSLAAEETMRLAAEKSRVLQSARLTGDGRFRLEGGAIPASGTVELNGVLQDAGDSVQMSVSADVLVSPGEDKSQTFRLQGAGDLIVAGQKELYFKIQSLSTHPEGSLFQPELVALLAGQWWEIPASVSGQEEDAVPGGATPSPSVLRAQAEVVRVVQDLGSTTLDGASAYHYSVAIDPDKLRSYLEAVATARNETLDRASLAQSIAGLAATGEMWIDAQTFFLKKVTWEIQEFNTDQGMLSGSFTLQLSDFDSAPSVAPPADAKPFSPSSFFGIQSGQNVSNGSLSFEQFGQYRSLPEEESVPTE